MAQMNLTPVSYTHLLYKLTQRPKALCDKVFERLFEEAEIAKFTPQEQREYEASKMAYRDIKNSLFIGVRILTTIWIISIKQIKRQKERQNSISSNLQVESTKPSHSQHIA